jgi:hypothetical protein
MAKHQHNRQFFDHLTPESCYWAGFIAADGYIGRHGNITLGLSEKDKTQVEKFKAAFGSTSPVRCFDTSNGYRSARIDVYGAYECQAALKECYSITQAKSLILKSPNLEEEDHIRAFIRGYVDGDGSICKTHQRNKPTWSFSMLGTCEMLQWIKLQIKYYVSDVGNPSPCKSRNVFTLAFGGHQIEHILDWLYRDSVDATRLSRKHDKYVELKQFYKDHKPRRTSSLYRGVGFVKRTGKWTAAIKTDRRIHIGTFTTELEAALAYNMKARELGLISRCYEVTS